MPNELTFECRRCGCEIPEDRESIRMCGPCTIDEMCESRQAPLCSGFEPFVDENMFSEPVVVKSSNHWKELQKVAGVRHIGTDGGNKLEPQKEVVARAVERANVMKETRKKVAKDIKCGNLPRDFGKKEPYNHARQLELERKRAESTPPIIV